MILFYAVDPSKVLQQAKDKIPNLVGIKHSSRELPNAYNCTLVDPERFQVLMGTDSVRQFKNICIGTCTTTFELNCMYSHAKHVQGPR